MIVKDAGRIMEQGDFFILMHQEGLFHKMFSSQHKKGLST